MNQFTRATILASCLGLCASGVVSMMAHVAIKDEESGSECFTNFDPQTGYEFVSADLQKFSFAQLEAIVRADAAVRFPHARVELGSVKTEHGGLTMTVLFFGPGRQARAYLYALAREKNSWKVARTQRLWFVPPSQIVRGLRV